MSSDERSHIQDEFTRAADAFARRTKDRFDSLGVGKFVLLRPGATVVEVGAGTGNFLSIFDGVAGTQIAVDVTAAMLIRARSDYPHVAPVVADGGRLPLADGSVDLVACAQMLHHVREPLPVIKEMRRVAGPDGRVLIVDSVATESYEQATFRTALETVRDPTHAASRPPSTLRILVQAAGMAIERERIVEDEQRLSTWMWPGEFPQERIDRVRDFIERYGKETGMGFWQDADDWVFTRRRMMILAHAV